MNSSKSQLIKEKRDTWDLLKMIRRAFAEFLTLPTLIISGFFLLAVVSYYLDHSNFNWLEPTRKLLKAHVFNDSKATSDLLGTIASSIITVTSITISLLLVALQQSAGSLTTSVFDQFLRRQLNQFYFGFFVGLAIYALITLATVNELFNPVFGATFAFLLTAIALYLLILLLYTTINQMRPVEIIEEIHNLTLLARNRQLLFLKKTRRTSSNNTAIITPVKAMKHGYVTRINIDAIGEAVRHFGDSIEIELMISIGSFVASNDEIAQVKGGMLNEEDEIYKIIQDAIHLERQRDIIIDPAYGIEQLEMIAWTSISTSKSNPGPGLLTIRSLRDVLACWSIEEKDKSDDHPFPVVYKDNTFARLMDAFETFAIVSSESMQHQNFIEVILTFTILFDRLPIEQQHRAEDIILRILSALGDHVLTAELDTALTAMIRKLRVSDCFETAGAVQEAQEQLKLSVGKLNSRASRVAVKG